ncbi:MAG: radical SAM protein [Paludibacter sp.]
MVAIQKKLNIKLVSIESGISAIGFRKIAGIARSIAPETEICFIPTDNLYSFLSHIIPNSDSSIKSQDLTIIATYLSSADFIGFSSMTISASFVEDLAIKIKKNNPKSFIFWGGVHPTLYSDIAIKHVDAICIGEGEVPLQMFMRGLKNGQILTNIPNMWFNVNNSIIKNKYLSLSTSDELNALPHSYNQSDCVIYDLGKKIIRPFNKIDYTTFNGLLFRTIWTLGCPFSCSYCANDSFIKLNKEHRKLRRTSVDYIIDEIKQAQKSFPFISTIAFYDDNFIALPTDIIGEFCNKYKNEINLPFVIFGMHPNIITKNKVELLASAGMNRARMGIQSGCEDTLKFYNRHTSIERINTSSSILADAARKYKMIPPAYDIISDNPVETNRNIIESLTLIYNLKRPFTLTVFSLRIFPQTQLFDYVKTNPKLVEYFKASSYLDTKKTINNVALYLLGIYKPPQFVFNRLINMVERENGLTKEYKLLFYLVKILYLAIRGIDHVRKFDFSTIVGGWTYYVWKITSIRPRKK